MRFDIPSAWDAHYALPDNVAHEPPRRSTMRPGYALPRGFYDAPKPSPFWDGGYALPANVEAEPVGTSPMVTKWLARRTVGATVPPLVPGAAQDIIDAGGGGTPEINALGGSEWMDAQAWRYGFGDEDAPGNTVEFDAWAEEVADGVLAAVSDVPRTERSKALSMALNKLEPGLAPRVQSAAKRLASQGLAPSMALRIAIQDNVKAGLIQEVIGLAYGGSPKAESLVGLGMVASYEALGWNPFRSAGRAIKKGAKKVGRGIKKGAKEVGKGIKKGAKAAADAAEDAAKFAGKATCKLLGSEKGQLAVAAGGAVAGVPPDQALVGAQVGAGMCQGASGGYGPPPPPAKPELPVGLILGGAAVLGAAIIISTSKRK